MHDWIIRSENIFNWASCWNKWIFNLLMIEHEEAYHKNNKNMRIAIRRP